MKMKIHQIQKRMMKKIMKTSDVTDNNVTKSDDSEATE